MVSTWRGKCEEILGRNGIERHHRKHGERRIVRRILRGVKPGAIILLHDGNIPADRLLATVKPLLAKLRERGYECVRLDSIVT